MKIWQLFMGRNGLLSTYEVHFKPSSFLLVDAANPHIQFEPVVKSSWGNLRSHAKFLFVWILKFPVMWNPTEGNQWENASVVWICIKMTGLHWMTICRAKVYVPAPFKSITSANLSHESLKKSEMVLTRERKQSKRKEDRWRSAELTGR